MHSRYNPQGEAERYINSLSPDQRTRYFILIEPGLGYMIAPLRKKVPGAKIIALHAQTAPAAAEHPQPDARWHPNAGITLQDFLEREIPDTAAAEIRILEWRPALALYGGAYRALVEESAAFIRQSDANLRTLNAFGRRWFRNFLKNLGIIRSVLCPSPLSLPFLVAASGPSLEDAFPLIRQRRPSLFVLAVASAAMALKTAGIQPNMAIATDGGQWAAFHLLDSFRGAGVPLAAALTAALPSRCADLPILPICDGSLWQTLILKELKIPFIVLPQRGTVSASALDLAFALTGGDIFISGLDLANSGIRTHARPYSFDRFPEETARRVNPAYSQAYKRSSLLKEGGSFAIYASWFEKQLAAYPRRLFSLGNNSRVFASLAEAPVRPQSAAGDVSFKAATLALEGSPSARACAVLEKALNDPASSAALQKELGPLLLGRDASLSELTEALRPLAGGR